MLSVFSSFSRLVRVSYISFIVILMVYPRRVMRALDVSCIAPFMFADLNAPTNSLKMKQVLPVFSVYRKLVIVLQDCDGSYEEGKASL